MSLMTQCLITAFQVVKLVHSSFGEVSSSTFSNPQSVWKWFCCLIAIPTTNTVSQRSFSAVLRIKSYLRSTMTQGCLKFYSGFIYS